MTLPSHALLAATALTAWSFSVPAQDEAKAADPGRITLEQTAFGSGGSMLNLRPRMDDVRWAPDGERVAIKREGAEAAVWLDPLTGVESAAITSDDDEEPGRTRRDRRRRRRDGGGGDTKELEKGGEVRLARVSDDGKWRTFVRENDLYIADAKTHDVRCITENGGPDQFNGALDWVYQEEIYGRGDFQGHFWSPSSKHTAFIALDESPVYEFTVVDHIEDGNFRVKSEVTNYPKVGDPNPIPKVGIVSVDSAETTWVDLSSYDGTEILIVRVGWTPLGDRCLVHVQDRIQTWADILSVDPQTGESSVMIHEESEAWTERPEDPIWLDDGTFLWHSHRTGPMHLYRYGVNGALVGAVTSGAWNFSSVDRVVQPTEGSSGSVLFECTEGGDINVNLYRVNLDGTGFTRLTQGDGTHRVQWNESRTMFIDRVTSLTNPGEVRVCTAEGKVLKTVAKASLPAAEEYDLGGWELHSVATRDGLELDVALLKPKDFDPTKSYAVWVNTYSGPAAPSVSNRWRGSAYFHFLAQSGVLVLQANVRTSTRRGPEATAALYRRVGLQEVEDMSDVVDWLTANPWADGSRVGITGYSFGGSMTANCLMRTTKFALGVAGGGVYDWRMYDSIYTERYMRTPADNLEGFESTSCLAQAGNLSGFLHMHHGIMDDNVHVQNMFQMSHALMRAGKLNWSMMAYPQTRHGIRDGSLAWHARQTEWALIEEHLLAN